MFAIVGAKNINAAPTTYGIIVFLYSAFSSALTIIYLIPITTNITTATPIPIACTTPNILDI